MTSFSSLRARLVGTVFLAILPAWVAMYFIAKRTGTEFPWPGFVVGLLALGAAWYGGERFILRQVRQLSKAAHAFAAGDLSSRTGVSHENGELGELARTFDKMAAFLEQRVKEREKAEKTLLNRSFQQTVVSALGQFALICDDFSALLNQAVMLVSQTLEVEYCHVLELQPEGHAFLLRAGVGWKEGLVGKELLPADAGTQAGFTLTAGEPVVVEDLPSETRFQGSPFLVDHGVVSGVTVAISGHGQAFGVLGAHTTNRRKFSEDEVHFLLAVATVLAMAAARKKADLERQNLEAQLRHSQKMESIGQLAAGVAHDFNNMLTIIQGHSGMLMVKPNLPPELFDSAQSVYFAAERAASLTRQLLMFSRKNVMQPKPLDLRDVVSQMSRMLQRLLGETVALHFQSPSEIPLVQGDTGMIEQVIMNLAVNARDAMSKGGTLTIRTDPIEITNPYLLYHPEARLGTFVCVRVADTGCGMDAATMEHIFEPFFTTKEVGKGTGLGLATVYGIVKQHGGWIEVESKVGKGSIFSLFFPASTRPVQAKSSETAPPIPVRGGKETILIVEDEPVLRDMAHVILEGCGYNILEAKSGREALKVWEQHRNLIDLLLTDMVMPEGISGMDLAQRLLTQNPRLKIVFASGYSMDDVDTTFVRRGRASFLQKPYTHVTLARAVRDCLDR